jgi:hydrogenase expression/formation protein HypE
MLNMNENKIILAHGSGGKRMDELIQNVFLKKFGTPSGGILPDSFVFNHNGSVNWAFTTDTFVVDPLFFPGGDIGKIAVSGTVNDLAVSGAIPLYLSASFIIEEGFPITELSNIVDSMAQEAENAGVCIVAGDTKVVQQGKADKLFINTSGIGKLEPALKKISTGEQVEAGDQLIVNGDIGVHAVAVMCEREDITFKDPVLSDVAPLNQLIQKVLTKTSGVSFMRDITRGGLGTIAREIVENRPFGIDVSEKSIPVPPVVQSYCDIFGYDPLYLANEGKVLMVVKPSAVKEILKILKDHPLGKNAAVIGEITEKKPGKVYMKTQYKGTRIVDKLSGEQLPRIC